jgi:LuxR family quorum-sensing system transcriptional regulator SolR
MFLPPVLAPLIHAAENGLDLVPAIRTITKDLGFDTFMYGVSTSLKPDHESRMYVFTTAPMEWVLLYDQRAYIEADPRILLLWDSTLPLVWDQTTVRGMSKTSDDFLDDALGHGIASGVCTPLRDESGTRVIVALNSVIPRFNDMKRQQISRDLGNMVVLTHYFHELFMKSVVRRGVPSRVTGMPLSARERQCLGLAARGMTSDDIAFKLGICSRTVQYHFDSIRSKLAAANRQEAVARAIKDGLINL